MRDLLCKISLSGCLHQDPIGPLVQDLSTRISCARSLCQDLSSSISRDGHTLSPQRAALENQKTQLRSTRTIPAKGCTSKSKNATLPAFRAIDTHDLRKRLHFEIRKCNFPSIPRTRHPRSPQRHPTRIAKNGE